MMRIVRTVVMAAATLGLVASAIVVAEAQERAQAGKSKAEKKASKAVAGAPSGSPDAEAALDKARRALDEGKTDVAQQLADSVLTSQSKDARNTARALALRGEAYLGQGRPAEALADLESALWVKGGLQGAERSSATMARGKAMEQAGLAKASPVLATPVPLPAPAVAPAPPVAARTIATAPAPAPAEREPPRQLAVARSVLAEPEPARVQPPTVSGAQTSGWKQATTIAPSAEKSEARASAAPVPTTAAASFPQPPRTAAASASPRETAATSDASGSSESSGGGLTGFLSGLFGNGASSGGQAPTTTAAVGSAPSRSATPATSSYEPQRIEPAARRQLPEAVAARTSPVRTAAMVAPAAQPQPPPQAAAAGAYRLQLAAVRTKAEAEEMVAKVREEEPAVLGKRNFEIVEDVYGNMGRFYRVRIGSFGEPTEALSICATLRDKRMDCMVLDR